MKDFKVCVYGICKNESKFVDRFMDSVGDADLVLIADTGSTDDTVAKLRARGAEVHSIKVDPWRFDVARNMALDLVPEGYDCLLSMDLDELIDTPDWKARIKAAWRSDTTRGSYFYSWSPKKRFLYTKMHTKHGYRWIYPCHEILEPTIKEKCVHIPIETSHTPDISKSRANYLPLLKLAMEENPDDPRAVHYYGRELYLTGQYAAAIPVLKKHAEMKSGWAPERAESCRMAAECLNRVSRNKASVIETYKRGCEIAPKSREPWVNLGKFYTLHKFYAEAAECGTKVLEITERKNNYLETKEAWGSAPHDLISVASYYLGDYEKALEHARLAAERNPKSNRLAKNLEICQTAWDKRKPVAPFKYTGEPCISVVIPVHVPREYLHECLRSISGQDGIKEILLGFDGECDALHDDYSMYPEVRTFRFSKYGPYAIRNTLTQFAAGSHILYFDADDVFMPGATRVLLKHLDYDYVEYRYSSFTEDYSVFGAGILEDGLLYALGQFMAKKSAMLEIGGYKQWPCAADYHLKNKMLKAYRKTASLPHTLYMRRKHPNQLTANGVSGMHTPLRARLHELIWQDSLNPGEMPAPVKSVREVSPSNPGAALDKSEPPRITLIIRMYYPDGIPQDRLDKFKRYTLPTLKAQTYKNFNVVLLVHDNSFGVLEAIDTTGVDIREDTAPSFDMRTMRPTKYNTGSEIQMRFDSDDCMAPDFMQTLVESCIGFKKPTAFSFAPVYHETATGKLYLPNVGAYSKRHMSGFSGIYQPENQEYGIFAAHHYRDLSKLLPGAEFIDKPGLVILNTHESNDSSGVNKPGYRPYGDNVYDKYPWFPQETDTVSEPETPSNKGIKFPPNSDVLL